MPQEIKTINLGAVNCYMVKVKDGFILIDTGGCTVFDTNLAGIREKLEKELERAGCRPGNLKLVVITHGDCDHTGNCAYLRDKYKTRIAMHSSDSYMVENGELSKAKVKSFLIRIMIIIMGFNKKKLMKMMSQFERFKPDLTIDEDFDLSQYGFDAKILYLPGHTKGSIGVLTSDGSLFCGDIIGNSGKPAVTFLVENSEELNSSVERIKKLSINTVYPGHGKPFQMSLFTK